MNTSRIEVHNIVYEPCSRAGKKMFAERRLREMMKEAAE